MTREEAINLIEEFMVIDDWSLVYLPDLHDALELAIEALKTETKKCPNCGSDLYEYCFLCCYEGEKVNRNE